MQEVDRLWKWHLHCRYKSNSKLVFQEPTKTTNLALNLKKKIMVACITLSRWSPTRPESHRYNQKVQIEFIKKIIRLIPNRVIFFYSVRKKLNTLNCRSSRRILAYAVAYTYLIECENDKCRRNLSHFSRLLWLQCTLHTTTAII